MAVFELDSDIVTGPAVPGAPPEPVLRIHEIQGNVLPGLNTFHQRLLGLRFEGAPDGMRGWLGAVAPRVATLARAQEQRNERRRALRRRAPRPLTPPLLNVALSADALRALAADADAVLDEAFKTGMYDRTSLGDPPSPQPGSPATWRVGGSPETTPHVLAIVAADEEDAVRAAGDSLAAEAQAAGATVAYDETGHLLPGGVEHFGFRDGVSQPGVRGRLSQLDRHFLARRYVHPDEPLALTHARPGQPLLWPGQFVFGYPVQDRRELGRPVDPPPAFGPDWMRDGSLLVFRRLRQDVAAFRAGVGELRAQVRAQAGIDVPEERMAAMVVGRWPGGTALVRNPDGDDPAPMDRRLVVNHFGFAQRTESVRVPDDRWVEQEELRPKPGVPERIGTVEGTGGDGLGRRCPRFAHVRKVNPRDLVTDQGDEADTLARLVLRRGITYGDPFPENADAADDADRGLLFLAYQTSLVDQFETLNTRWMNRQGAPEGQGGHDLLVGQAQAPGGRRARLTLGPRDVELRTEGRWVVPTGGGYFFAPSISCLRRFAGPPG